MIKYFVRILLSLFILLIISIWLTGCGSHDTVSMCFEWAEELNSLYMEKRNRNCGTECLERLNELEQLYRDYCLHLEDG